MSRDTTRERKSTSDLPSSSRRAKNELHPVVREGLATLRGQAALGERAGKRARRVQVLGGRELRLPRRCACFAGYSLHAGVGFEASDG